MSPRRQREQKRAAAPKPRRANWNWPPLLFLAAVLVMKAVVLAQLQQHPLLEPGGGVDSAEYVALARRVLGGDVLLGPGLYYLSPLYVYFLAALLAISDSFTFVQVTQIALGTAAVWCIYVAARAWFGTRAAWIAAGLAALTGVFTFYEIVVFQSSIDVFLTAAGLACLAKGLAAVPGAATIPPKGGNHMTAAVPPEGGSHTTEAAVPPKGGSHWSDSVASAFRRNSTEDVASAFRRNALLAGLFFGLQFLNRPNIAIAIAGVIFALIATRRSRAAAWMAAGLAIAVTPVAARNAIVTHRFALTSSQGGLNLYIGNHDGATGQYVAVPGVRANMAGQAEDTRKVAEAAMRHPLSDAEVSSYFTGLATAWIREHPAAAAKLFVRKLALTLNARHQWLDFSYPYYAYDTGSLLGWLFVGPWLLVPLGFVGAALLVCGSPSPLRGFGETGGTVATGPRAAWFVFVPAYALSVALFFVAERYRLPLFVPLCVLSGGAVDWLLQAFPRRPSAIGHRPSTAAAAAAVTLLIAGATVAYWPFRVEDGRFEERLRLSKALMNRRDPAGAATELEKALAIRPGDPTAEFHLGIALLSDGRGREGLDHLRRGVDAGVAIPGARYALVNAMLATGDRDGAVTLLRTYSPAPEDTADSCFQVAQLALNAGAPLVAERYLQRALQLRPGWPAALQLLQQIR